MKSLGAIVCVALMMVPFATSAPAGREHPQLLESLRINEEITGTHIDISGAELLGERAFTLPPGVGVRAAMDLATGTFDVGRALAAADTGGTSGCTLVGGSIGFGYTVTPTAVSNIGAGCSAQTHPGGISSMELTCENAQFCEVVGYGAGSSYMYIYCQFTGPLTIVGPQSPPAPDGPVTAVGSGTCAAFDGGNVATLSAYNAYVYQYPPGPATTTTTGLVN